MKNLQQEKTSAFSFRKKLRSQRRREANGVSGAEGGSDTVPSELRLGLMNYLCLVKSLALLIRQEA